MSAQAFIDILALLSFLESSDVCLCGIMECEFVRMLRVRVHLPFCFIYRSPHHLHRRARAQELSTSEASPPENRPQGQKGEVDGECL